MHFRPDTRRVRAALGLCVVVALVVLGAAGCRPVDRAKPILFVHGWSAGGGTSCASTFDGMISRLRAQGFTGPFIRVGFYDGDTGCDVNLRSFGSLENGSSWKDVAKAFSNYVATTFTSKGVTVDAVGHSMGGNIIRGAVQGSAARESGFAAGIRVEDVVSLAAPFDGAAWYSNFCLWGQCSSLKPGADEIAWLDLNRNPQGAGGTEWTVFGSTNDDVVPSASATDIDLPAARKVVYSDAEHSDYMGRADVVARAGDALAKIDS